MRLKGDHYTEDPRLDRIPQFDSKSRNFPIRTAATPLFLRSMTWGFLPSLDFLIDQGVEGACVGFSIVNELTCRPAPMEFSSLSNANQYARSIYWGAQVRDPWAGGSYPGASPFYEGTSVLAGLQEAQSRGHFKAYRWAFGLRDLCHGLSVNGPAILGIDWHYSMYSPDAEGWIEPTGPVAGGHAILARALRLVWRKPNQGRWEDLNLDESYILLRNSWGEWGSGGDARIRLTDMDTLLRANGEAAFALRRTTLPRPVA